ncbi:MAG: hypothetical protein ACO1RT_00665 [Planctomycetaceae bacterium]
MTISDHQWRSLGRTTAIGQLTPMMHPVHRPHQEHVPARAEIQLKLAVRENED